MFPGHWTVHATATSCLVSVVSAVVLFDIHWMQVVSQLTILERLLDSLVPLIGKQSTQGHVPDPRLREALAYLLKSKFLAY